MTNAATPAELAIGDDLKTAINSALENGLPMLLAYVDEEGQPSLSYRGSTQVLAADQLAAWIRIADGALAHSLEKNPHVTFLYRDPGTRSTLQFKGRGRIEAAEPLRSQVYESSPKREQDADPEKKGTALVVDLDLVIGTFAGSRILMKR